MDPYPEFFIEAASIRGVYESTSQDAAAIARLLGAHGVRTVLDLPCGFGRIAGPLHHQGFEVTAVDASPAQIDTARKRNPGPDYQVGDMLNPPSGPFDAMLNIYTSFGYMPDEAQDRLCLGRWHGALRSGGILVLETLDTERVAKIDEDERDLQRDDGVFVRKTGSLTEYIFTDPVTRIMSIEYRLNGQVFTSRTRLYHRDQLLHMLRDAGFPKVELYSSFELEPVAPTSHTVFVAIKQ